MDDLCVRFIINLPQEELQSVHRICFQVEEAQWFYEDFIRPQDPDLPSLTLKMFCTHIFEHCPLLSGIPAQLQADPYTEFLDYKTRVPVRGAIMLNQDMDQVVLVKGWRKSATWSFPRGKINKDETDLDCAVREVYEETGHDLKEASRIADNQDFVETTIRAQHIKLYIFPGVPMNTHFEPRTRKEISEIEWCKLSELPAMKRQERKQEGRGEDLAINAKRFYMVAPFMAELKRWIAKQKNVEKLNGSSHSLVAPETAPSMTTAVGSQLQSPAKVGKLSNNADVPIDLEARLRQSNQARAMTDLPEVWKAPITVHLVDPPLAPATLNREYDDLCPNNSYLRAGIPVPSMPNHLQNVQTELTLPTPHPASTKYSAVQPVADHHASDTVQFSESSSDKDGFQPNFDRRMLHPSHPIPSFVPSLAEFPQPKLTKQSSTLLSLFKGMQTSKVEALPRSQFRSDGLQLAEVPKPAVNISKINGQSSVLKQPTPSAARIQPPLSDRPASGMFALDQPSTDIKGKYPTQGPTPVREPVTIIAQPRSTKKSIQPVNQDIDIPKHSPLMATNSRTPAVNSKLTAGLSTAQHPEVLRRTGQASPVPVQWSGMPASLQPLSSPGHMSHQSEEHRKLLLSLLTQPSNRSSVSPNVLSPCLEGNPLQQTQRRPTFSNSVGSRASSMTLSTMDASLRLTPKTTPVDRKVLLGYLERVANEKH